MLCLLLTLVTFVELNCENLFDCRHDTLKEDYDYLPSSDRRWTPPRYRRKLNNIGQAILSCGTLDDIPSFVALCEIENDSAAYDLCRRSLLCGAGYEYVITSSPDPRGIDVALLYQKSALRLIGSKSIRVPPPKGQHPSRDILWVTGTTWKGDTLHIFVAHLPSRLGGTGAARYRRAITSRLTAAIDSILTYHPRQGIIVSGDMNETSDGEVTTMMTDAGLIEAVPRLSEENIFFGARGTYCYEGAWQSIDHILLSPALAARIAECRVHAPAFLLEEDKRYGGFKPFRSYYGYKWRRDGTSDHLPLVMRLDL